VTAEAEIEQRQGAVGRLARDERRPHGVLDLRAAFVLPPTNRGVPCQQRSAVRGDARLTARLGQREALGRERRGRREPPLDKLHICRELQAAGDGRDCASITRSRDDVPEDAPPRV
jgi:hypothetical protein